jgi:beta-glucanase (GH16 family)
MSSSIAPVTQILLQDYFGDNASLDPTTWDYNHFSPINNPSFNGRTQMEQFVPTVSDGALQLTVQTYNPTSSPPGTSFLGSEVISKQNFNVAGNGSGIAFTAVARIATTVPGMVGGIFGYNINAASGPHNELDFESLSNDAAAQRDRALTNVYSNQPLGAGNFEYVPGAGPTDYQTYTMEWFPDKVLWFINGQLVRDSSIVPQGSMAFHLNFYAPASDWADAYSPLLQPTANPTQNNTYTFEVAYASVAAISEQTPGIAVEDTSSQQTVDASTTPYTGPVSGVGNQYINITSDSLNISVDTPDWFIHSGSGNDAIAVSSGTNVLDGGTGSNFLSGGSGTDTFFVDDRGPTADIWSTASNFHAGDAATIWGITSQDFNLTWADGQGAAGYTGLTLHATAPGMPIASLTLVGFTQADLSNGRLSVSFGNVGGSAYMYIHENS